MASETSVAIQKTLAIAESIRRTLDPPFLLSTPLETDTIADTTSTTSVHKICLPAPQPIEAELVATGLRHSTAKKLSNLFLEQANGLKISSEKTVRNACMRLSCHPRHSSAMTLVDLQRRFIEVYHQKYISAIEHLVKEALDLVRSHVVFGPGGPSKLPSRKTRRHFKAEYLPLFEFAFEKDRFPSREDKKHLARISGMSYRQVNVWFQNRRCRQPSRAKSHRFTSAPRTFEEMKAHLGPSARAVLSESTPLTEGLNPDLTNSPVVGAPVLMRSFVKASPLREVIVLDDEELASPVKSTCDRPLETTSTPGLTSRSVSLEATEVATRPEPTTRATSLGLTDDGFASDERDDSSDEDAVATSRSQRSAIVKMRSTPPQKQNPLNPFRTSVHAFPTPYAPSQLTSDPFIIEYHPWLRDPRINSRKFINPTPETMEEILGDFDHMDVDDPDATVIATDEQLSLSPKQRIVSAGSSATWSSSESTAASRAPSYSSSVRSSSQFSDAEPASLSECTTLEVAECASSSPVTEKTSLPRSDAETSAGSPGEDSKTAGPSVAGLEEASPLQSSFLKDKSSSTDSNWEALLAAATS